MRRSARVHALPILDAETVLSVGSLGLLLVVVLLLIVPQLGAT
jgi:hypothetical protein